MSEMNPQRYDIYDAHVRFGKADYPRPCILTDIHNDGTVTALLISSAKELYVESTFNFRIDSDDPDFAATGLKSDSYISAERFVKLKITDLIRKRGRLESELLKRYRKWI